MSNLELGLALMLAGIGGGMLVLLLSKVFTPERDRA